MAKKCNYPQVVVKGARPPVPPRRCHLPKIWNAKNWNADIPVVYKKPWLPWKKRELERVEKMVQSMPGWDRFDLVVYLLEVKWDAHGVVYLP